MAAPRNRMVIKLPRGGAALTLTERVKSRELTESSGRTTLDFEYDLRGTPSELIAYTYLVDNTPRVYENLFRMELSVKPIQVDEVANTGHWLCTVRYATGDVVPRELTDSAFMFDTGGGTQHITQSLGTVPFAPPGKTATDHHSAIRVGPDLKVEGVDVPAPQYNFAEAHVFADSAVNPLFKGQLFYLTGRINDALFKGFRRGECLFRYVSGMRRGLGDWELTFHFSASPNIYADTPIVVRSPDGDITIDNALGWDYVWVEYGKKVDANSNRMAASPLAAYVERVAYEGNFGLLQIGT